RKSKHRQHLEHGGAIRLPGPRTSVVRDLEGGAESPHVPHGRRVLGSRHSRQRRGSEHVSRPNRPCRRAGRHRGLRCEHTNGHNPAADRQVPMNVAFVNAPFSSIRPAIGVSLLKAHLQPMGVESEVLYLNMAFAQRLGLSDYRYLAEFAPPPSLIGDWIFSRTMFGRRREAEAEYLAMYSSRFGRLPDRDSKIALLGRAQALAERFVDEWVDTIDWRRYDVVGFTTTFTQNVASLALARRLKQRFSHLHTVFGGANCEAEMGLQLHQAFQFVDFVCSGEADVSFPRLIGALKSGARVTDIPGVIARADGESRYSSLTPERVKDLDSLPHPDYDDYFRQLAQCFPALVGRASVLMESSRGCWWGAKHHCTFCGLNGTSMAFRSKSPGRVLDELAALRERYGASYVEMVDNILDMRYFREVLPQLRQTRLKVALFYETKANLTRAQVESLRDAGVSNIQPGIESFSTQVLGIMRKGTTGIQNVQLLKWCREFGVKPYWNLLYGFPGENPAEYEAMADTIESIRHFDPPHGVGGVRLDRFSPNYFDAVKLGLCNVRPDRSYACIYDLP